MPVIVVTRLRLRDPALLDEFFTDAVAAIEQAMKSEGAAPGTGRRLTMPARRSSPDHLLLPFVGGRGTGRRRAAADPAAAQTGMAQYRAWVTQPVL